MKPDVDIGGDRYYPMKGFPYWEAFFVGLFLILENIKKPFEIIFQRAFGKRL